MNAQTILYHEALRGWTYCETCQHRIVLLNIAPERCERCRRAFHYTLEDKFIAAELAIEKAKWDDARAGKPHLPLFE